MVHVQSTHAGFATILLIVLSCLHCSCRDDEADARTARLEAQLATQKDTQAKLTAFVVSEGDRLEALVRDKMDEKYVMLDPHSKNYSTIISDIGSFVTYCRSVEPYLDGHKLILYVGNPYYMKFVGFTLDVKYGLHMRDYPKNPTPEQSTAWLKDYSEWQNKLKQQTTSFTDELLPGTWTKIEVILAPSRPEEVDYISIGMKTNQVALTKVKE